MNETIFSTYFPQLSPKQIGQFVQLKELYLEWNQKINLLSRKDTDFIYEKHILHALGIAKVEQFSPNAKILDVGTGGGIPGIPLAIMFPDSDFLLVDSIGKKIAVVQDIISRLGLKNVSAKSVRAEQINEKFHFIVSRAVTQMSTFIGWTRDKFEKKSLSTRENGILYLKGGDLREELGQIKHKSYDLKDFFQENFFETKKVIYINHKNL